MARPRCIEMLFVASCNKSRKSREITMHRFPSLYQINTRVWLTGLSKQLQRPATLDDVPDRQLEWLQREGFEWVWFLGVWQTGPASRKVALEDPDLRREYKKAFPGFRNNDISGSPFAIQCYALHRDFGEAAALARLCERLHAHGLKLLLDFVPNHTGLDHAWVQQHPEFYLHGSEEQLQQHPRDFVRMETGEGLQILAHGRDPYVPAWTDTLQLNYASRALQQAMRTELLHIAGQCDGVRCDMAMLLLPEVFERTWGMEPAPFWDDTIPGVRGSYPQFVLMAEVYWGLEETLQQLGFDYTYDKRLYDRLLDLRARPVCEHFQAGPEFQRKSVRFLENHDERRAAAVFSPDVHEAAAVLTYLSPGLRLFHQGQFEGRRIHIPIQLTHGPAEPENSAVRSLYQHLLACLQRSCVRDGAWQLRESSPAWEGNWTDDNFICWQWNLEQELPLLICVNYSAMQSQCYVHLPDLPVASHTVVLQDLMHPTAYTRDTGDLRQHGLYLDLPAWGCHVFELHPSARGSLEAPRAERAPAPP